MKTTDEIKRGLRICGKNDNCDGCPYGPCGGDPRCVDYLEHDALDYIEQLEEQITIMKVQMHGDCGVCKHRSEQEAVFRKAAKKGEFAFTQRCEDCIKNGKSAWEYEGIPEVKSK